MVKKMVNLLAVSSNNSYPDTLYSLNELQKIMESFDNVIPERRPLMHDIIKYIVKDVENWGSNMVNPPQTGDFCGGRAEYCLDGDHLLIILKIPYNKKWEFHEDDHLNKKMVSMTIFCKRADHTEQGTMMANFIDALRKMNLETFCYDAQLEKYQRTGKES